MRRSTLCLALCLVAPRALANSMVTHVWVAEQAIERIEPGPLRDIVADPALRAVIQNGAIYQDSGYSVRHPYGEWAHWESFLEPYARWIRGRWGAEGYRSPDARRHVAFLLGNAAHSITDQTFDQYFMARVQQYDRFDETLDVGSDAWLVVEHGVSSAADGRFWFDEMPMIHAAVGGPAVTPEVLRSAAGMTAGATQFLTRYAYTLYELHWRRMPWAASHYWHRDTPGAYPHLVDVTAAYWRFLWLRLQGTAPDDAPPLYSWPAPGQTNFPVAHTDIESRVVVTTPWGLDDATVNATTVRLLGPGDVPVAARVSRYGSEGNTLMIRSAADLAFDTAYRLELGATIRTLAGRPLGRALSIPFRTRCAPDRLAACPPLATPRPTLTEPPVRDAGPPSSDAAVTMVGDAGSVAMVMAPSRAPDAGCGCRAQGTSRGGLAWIALAVAGARAARRRRVTRAR